MMMRKKTRLCTGWRFTCLMWKCQINIWRQWTFSSQLQQGDWHMANRLIQSIDGSLPVQNVPISRSNKIERHREITIIEILTTQSVIWTMLWMGLEGCRLLGIIVGQHEGFDSRLWAKHFQRESINLRGALQVESRYQTTQRGDIATRKGYRTPQKYYLCWKMMRDTVGDNMVTSCSTQDGWANRIMIRSSCSANFV